MAHEIADDDIVRTLEEAAANERPPLLVLDPLLAFLDQHDLGDGEPVIRPIGDGHSNATYLFDRGGARFVLRRPPRPPIPPSANDMLREARVLRGLEGPARGAACVGRLRGRRGARRAVLRHGGGHRARRHGRDARWRWTRWRSGGAPRMS